jgi:hypothetical protein
MDTRNKRASAVGFLLPFRVVYPDPSGAVGESARAQTVYSYAGSLAAAVPSGDDTMYLFLML